MTTDLRPLPVVKADVRLGFGRAPQTGGDFFTAAVTR
jgi:hypothetical protein